MKLPPSFKAVIVWRDCINSWSTLNIANFQQKPYGPWQLKTYTVTPHPNITNLPIFPTWILSLNFLETKKLPSIFSIWFFLGNMAFIAISKTPRNCGHFGHRDIRKDRPFLVPIGDLPRSQAWRIDKSINQKHGKIHMEWNKSLNFFIWRFLRDGET